MLVKAATGRCAYHYLTEPCTEWERPSISQPYHHQRRLWCHFDNIRHTPWWWGCLSESLHIWLTYYERIRHEIIYQSHIDWNQCILANALFSKTVPWCIYNFELVSSIILYYLTYHLKSVTFLVVYLAILNYVIKSTIAPETLKQIWLILQSALSLLMA